MARTPYTPPASNAVDFSSRGAYSPPAFDSVDFGVIVSQQIAGQDAEWALQLSFENAGQDAEWRLQVTELAGQTVEYRLAVDAFPGQTAEWYLLLQELGQTAEWQLTAPFFAGQDAEWDLNAQQEAAQNAQWSLSQALDVVAQDIEYELKILTPAGQTLEWNLPSSVQLPQTGDLRFVYSGGENNLDPLQSIGGQRSSRELAGQDVSDTTPLDGIEIVYAARNNAGPGQLIWTAQGAAVAWQGPGQSVGEGVILAEDGEYTVHDGNGYVVLNVDANSLSAEDLTVEVGIRQPKQSLFPDIQPSQAAAGFIDYACLYIYNANPDATLFDLRVYVAQQSNGPDIIAIGLDPAGVGDGVSSGVAIAVPDRYTAPVGVSFSQPDSGNPLSIGDVQPGQSAALWFQRSLASNVSIYYPYVSFELGVLIN